MTAIAHLEQLYEQHQAEEQAANEAAERESNAKGRLEFQRRLERLQQIIPTEALQSDWSAVSPESGEWLRLRSRFLPEDPLHLRISFDERWSAQALYVSVVDPYLRQLQEFRTRFDPAEWRSGPVPADMAARRIASIVVPALKARSAEQARVERERQARAQQDRHWKEQRAREERQSRERQERAVAAGARADQLAAARLHELEQLRADVEARFSWPAERSLFAYHLRWLNGVSSDGEYQDWGEAWSPDARPEADSDFWRVFQPGGIGHLAIRTTNALVVEQYVWRSAEDLPFHLRQKVHFGAPVEVVHERGAYQDYSVARNPCLEPLLLPGVAVRPFLGLPADPVPPTTLEVQYVPLDDQVPPAVAKEELR